MSEIFSTLAIILGRKNIGEADRLLTLFTSDFGKIKVKAKGVRRALAKRKSHIELFNTVKCQIIQNKGYHILAQTELISDRSSIKSHLKLLRIAYHLVEIVERLTPEGQKQIELFNLLDRALSSINLDQWEDEERLTLAFEGKLLKLLGYGIPQDQKMTESYIENLIEQKLRSREVLKE